MASLGHVAKTAARKTLLFKYAKCQMCQVLGQGTSNTQSLKSNVGVVLPMRYTDFRSHQVRYMSGGERNFLKQLFDNLKEEFKNSQEMKESLKKFREEREKLEKSEDLQKAREKFEKIESETQGQLKKTVEEYKDKISETLDEVSKTEYVRKGMEYSEQVGKTAGKVAGKAAETITKTGKTIGEAAPVKKVSKAVLEELKDVTSTRAATYRAPEILRKRTEHSSKDQDKEVEADDDTTTMVLHKDSQLHQKWQNFKDNNQFINKFFDLKMQYDESDNLAVRASRAVTDKIGSLFGGMFTKTEMSEVLTEICKMDPNFEVEGFIRQCQQDIIPNILEAVLQGELDILQDWCYEAVYNTIAHPIQAERKSGQVRKCQVIDINQIDIAAAKMMEQGPVLLISFYAQQIMVIRDQKGDIVEGDPEKVQKIGYIWALCRDQEELNPMAAWRLLDMSARDSTELWI